MRSYQRFIVDLSDVYGRMIPGAILLIDVYFILLKTALGIPLKSGVSSFYSSSVTLFSITFLLVSFLIGHIPLGLSFRFLPRFKSRKSINDFLSSGIDPTVNGQIKKLFEQHFGKDALNDSKAQILNVCKHLLLCNNPDLYSALRGIEAHMNLRAGVVSPLFLTALVFAIYGHFIICGLFVLISSWFLIEFYGTIRAESKSTILLYYHATHCAQAGQDTDSSQHAP